MRKLLLSTIICLGLVYLQAQSIDREVISSYGQLTATTSATVGEAITASLSGSFILNQGFQQNDVLISGIEKVETLVNYTLYPNPATDVLHVELQSSESTELSMYIVNSMGQMVSQQKNAQLYNQWNGDFNIANYAPGNYLLIVANNQDKQVKSIAFIKK